MAEEAGPARKRKRGIQQRIENDYEARAQESKVNTLLMSYLAEGLLSAVMVSSIAQAAMEDVTRATEGSHFPDLKKTASCQHGKNLSGVVTNLLKKSSPLPQPMQVNMPYKSGCSDTALLLPHELFAYMFGLPAVWARCVCSSLGELRKFWDVFERHPCMLNRPCKADGNWKSTTVPLQLHGDEVPILGVGKIWCHSALQFNWSSIIAACTGGTMAETIFYVWGVFERFVCASTATAMGTMDVFFSILAWSFTILYEGVWPTHDWRGIRNLVCLLHTPCDLLAAPFYLS